MLAENNSNLSPFFKAAICLSKYEIRVFSTILLVVLLYIFLCTSWRSRNRTLPFISISRNSCVRMKPHILSTKPCEMLHILTLMPQQVIILLEYSCLSFQSVPDIVQPFALVFEIAGAGDGVFAASEKLG